MRLKAIHLIKPNCNQIAKILFLLLCLSIIGCGHNPENDHQKRKCRKNSYLDNDKRENLSLFMRIIFLFFDKKEISEEKITEKITIKPLTVREINKIEDLNGLCEQLNKKTHEEMPDIVYDKRYECITKVYNSFNDFEPVDVANADAIIKEECDVININNLSYNLIKHRHIFAKKHVNFDKISPDNKRKEAKFVNFAGNSEFLIKKSEVTVEEWLSIKNIYLYKKEDQEKCKKCPVTYISALESIIFLNKKSKEDGFTECYTLVPANCDSVTDIRDESNNSYSHKSGCKFEVNKNCNGYRLPTKKNYNDISKSLNKKEINHNKINIKNKGKNNVCIIESNDQIDQKEMVCDIYGNVSELTEDASGKLNEISFFLSYFESKSYVDVKFRDDHDMRMRSQYVGFRYLDATSR